MATTDEEDIPPAPTATVGDRFGEVWEEFISIPGKASDIVYAARSRSLWPIALVGVTFAALWVGGAVAGVCGSLAVFVLGYWAMSGD